MRIALLTTLFALSLAPDSKAEEKPAATVQPAKPAPEEKAAATPAKAAPGDKTAPPATKPVKKEESLDDLLNKAPENAVKPAEPTTAGTENSATTESADLTPEAPAPTAFTPVAKVETRSRTLGPYELGPVDCRVLDDAGIERILPSMLNAGEEPDLLCRVLVVQPPNVAAVQHDLSLNVFVGSRLAYQQTRRVRMSSFGRRSILFVIPADRITSYETTQVIVRASLSMPAKPATREVRFSLETQD